MNAKSDFENSVLVHLDAMYRVAYALCGNKDTAEDVVQTASLKAFKNFGSFKKGTNCKAWLMRILRNTWFDQLRRQRTAGIQVPLDENIAVEAAQVNETQWTDSTDLLENFSDEQVIKALQSLPDEQRLTLYLLDVEGFSQDEVAEITDVAVGTVKSRTSRGRMKLKSELLVYAREMGLTGGEL